MAKVKPLDWQRFNDREGDLRAATIVGVYMARPSAVVKGGSRLYLPGAPHHKSQVFEDLAAAQSAAWIDYEARILSAFSPGEAVALDTAGRDQTPHAAYSGNDPVSIFLRSLASTKALRNKHVRLTVEEAENLSQVIRETLATPPNVVVKALESGLSFAQSWLDENGGIDGCDYQDRFSFELIRDTLSALTSQREETPSPQPNVVPEELLDRTFSAHHNPNCASPWLVRMPGKSGVIDFLPYGDPLGLARHETGDVLGFGDTLLAAGFAALTARENFSDA